MNEIVQKYSKYTLKGATNEFLQASNDVFAIRKLLEGDNVGLDVSDE